MTQEKEQLPVWMSPGIEPPESIKQSGWQPGVKPPAQYMDWFFHRTYKVLEQLQNGGNLDELQGEIEDLQTDFTQHLEQTASTMQKGHVQLTSATNSDSETLGATAKAVKTAYDRAEQAFTQANNGKELIATAIIGKNGTASSSDSFQQLASAIGGLGGATLDVVYTGTAQIISTTFSYSTHSIPDIGNIDDCFVMIRGAYDFPASSGFGAETCTIEIMSSTSIRIQRGGAYAYASSKYIYDIIRVSGLKSFQKGTYIPSGNSYSFTSPSSIPITPVNKNKSVLLFNLRTSTTNPEPKQLIPLLRINDDGNAILFNGYSGMTINYTILEFE